MNDSGSIVKYLTVQDLKEVLLLFTLHLKNRSGDNPSSYVQRIHMHIIRKNGIILSYLVAMKMKMPPTRITSGDLRNIYGETWL